MTSATSTRHLFSIDDLGVREILGILKDARSLKDHGASGSELRGKLAGLCFFQESTRTRAGFDAAIKRLGGNTILLNEQRDVLRAPTAESIEDTVRVLSGYCDFIVMRHSSTLAVERGMSSSIVPVINAGSGVEHHPTQALVDLFYLLLHFGRIENLRIGIVGDIANSRAARSLLGALRHWPPKELRLIQPDECSSNIEYLRSFHPSTISYRSSLDCGGLDVLYVAGLPNPASSPPFSGEARGKLILTPGRLKSMPEMGIVLCPLPRIDEIDVAVDRSPKAAYFSQSDYGMWVRMAIAMWLVNNA